MMLSNTKSVADRKWDHAAYSLCSYTDLHWLQISPVVLPRHGVALILYSCLISISKIKLR